ncbi:MAG: O-unit flippase-like protein [Eggerthellaceae bacterium]|nr:O-unit flippase-like protein [Eggerthellaceae bacterium]
MAIRTTRSDVIWNYVGTTVSMASGFVLLPLLIYFLSGEELGLWYVYVAVANLAALFEFGFNPTFARNIVYVVSGARRLLGEGRDGASLGEGVDWHLLNTLIRASKAVYAAIALLVLLLLATAGSAYVAYVSAGLDGFGVWASWGVFCASVFLNLYFLWSTTVLRGYGDVAGEKKATTLGKLAQLAVSAALLLAGAGLVGAAVGYLANAAVMRVAAVAMLRRHRGVEEGRRGDPNAVSVADVRAALPKVAHLAWRDGVVQIALYTSTQATSITCSLFLGLAETGTYSVLLQLATAVYNLAVAYPKTFFPAMQSAFAEGDVDRQRRYVSEGVVAYWVLLLFGIVGVCVAVLPLLPLIKPGVTADYGLFLGLCVYLGLLQQHSVCCNYIISMNEIPYMRGYLLAAALGAALVWLLCGPLGWGAWGIVAGQAASQAVYNNWRWPQYLCRRLGTTYPAMLREGAARWASVLKKKLGLQGG